MSMVTNVIVTMGLVSGKEDEDKLALALATDIGSSLKDVTDYAGGSKAIEATVLMGAYNYLNEDEFLEWLKGPLKEALGPGLYSGFETVRVFINRHEETGFHQVFSGEDEQWNYEFVA